MFIYLLFITTTVAIVSPKNAPCPIKVQKLECIALESR